MDNIQIEVIAKDINGSKEHVVISEDALLLAYSRGEAKSLIEAKSFIADLRKGTQLLFRRHDG